MYGTDESTMSDFRTEADSLGRIEVPAEKLWGAQTQRSLQHFSIGRDLMPADNDPTLKEAALQLGHVDEATFDRVVDPAKMVKPYVAHEADRGVRAVDHF
jgi:fumarate hydratase class II